MKIFGKILLWIGGILFVFVGPAVIADLADVGKGGLQGLYLVGLALGFALGIWHRNTEQKKEWVEFKRTHTFKRKDFA